MADAFLYPPTPENVPASITAPSPSFKKEVPAVMGSIIFFFVVYVLLLLLSVALVIGCFYAGIAIITNMPKLITILAGLGLMGAGIMVFIFLIKFIFSVSRYDRSGIIEITEAEQPALFGFIRKLATDTQTPFPKRIYLSADVNACVFYDSSFWSMFFPVRKNLQVGLGLVNSLSVSEFKAVIAHEFGHFSQRSMKLGSFVYHVNKIIYNMLFDNKGYSEFLQGWAKIDGIFALFAGITAGIAQGIQGILKGLYGFINKKYMSLSREMEFHADAVAASVSGSESLGTSLRRIEMAASGYDIALNKCDELFREKKISINIYPNHKSVMQQIANTHNLPVKNGLPVVTADFLKSMNYSRVNFRDQWASHPSTEDRIRHLNELAVPAEVWDQPAWELFQNREDLQQQLTKKIYEQAGVSADAETIGEKDFDIKLLGDISNSTFPAAYNGFYDERMIEVPGAGFTYDVTEPAGVSMGTLFTEENALITKKIAAAIHDLDIVKAITEKRIQAKSFDFEGIKYNRNEASPVIDKLEAEIAAMKAEQKKNDLLAIRFFLHKAGQKSSSGAEKLKAEYEDYFDLRNKSEAFLKTINTLLEPLQQIFSGQSVQVEEIHTVVNQLTGTHEPLFKNELDIWKQKGAFAKNPVIEDRITRFIAARYVYFHENGFMEGELSELHELCNESWTAVNSFIFEKFKSILELQLQYGS